MKNQLLLVLRWQSIRFRESRRHSSQYRAQSRQSFSWDRLQTLAARVTQISLTQPAGEQSKTGDQVDQARWYPHDQASELLVFERCQSPRRRESGVRWIPN